MLSLQHTILNWTNHAGWFPPSVLMHFEVFSASSDIVLWKLLSLSSELNNLNVKQTGPNWLILFFFFFTKWPKPLRFGLTKSNSLLPCPNFSLWPQGRKKIMFCAGLAHFQVTTSFCGWFESNKSNPEILFVLCSFHSTQQLFLLINLSAKASKITKTCFDCCIDTKEHVKFSWQN